MNLSERTGSYDSKTGEISGTEKVVSLKDKTGTYRHKSHHSSSNAQAEKAAQAKAAAEKAAQAKAAAEKAAQAKAAAEKAAAEKAAAEKLKILGLQGVSTKNGVKFEAIPEDRESANSIYQRQQAEKEQDRINSLKIIANSSGNNNTKEKIYTNTDTGNKIKVTTTKIDKIVNGVKTKFTVIERKDLTTGEISVKTYEWNKKTGRTSQTGELNYDKAYKNSIETKTALNKILMKEKARLDAGVRSGKLTLAEGQKIYDAFKNARTREFNKKQSPVISGIVTADNKTEIEKYIITINSKFNKVVMNFNNSFKNADKDLTKLYTDSKTKRINLNAELEPIKEARAKEIKAVQTELNSKLSNAVTKSDISKAYTEANNKIKDIKIKYDWKGSKIENEILKETGKSVFYSFSGFGISLFNGVKNYTFDKQTRDNINQTIKTLATNKESREAVYTIVGQEFNKTVLMAKTNPGEAIISVGGDLLLGAMVGKAFRPLAKISKNAIKGTVRIGGKTIRKVKIIDDLFKYSGKAIKISKAKGKTIIKVAIKKGKKSLKKIPVSSKKIITKAQNLKATTKIKVLIKRIEKLIGVKLTSKEKIKIMSKFRLITDKAGFNKQIERDIYKIISKSKRDIRTKNFVSNLKNILPKKQVTKKIKIIVIGDDGVARLKLISKKELKALRKNKKIVNSIPKGDKKSKYQSVYLISENGIRKKTFLKVSGKKAIIKTTKKATKKYKKIISIGKDGVARYKSVKIGVKKAIPSKKAIQKSKKIKIISIGKDGVARYRMVNKADIKRVAKLRTKKVKPIKQIKVKKSKILSMSPEARLNFVKKNTGKLNKKFELQIRNKLVEEARARLINSKILANQEKFKILVEKSLRGVSTKTFRTSKQKLWQFKRLKAQLTKLDNFVVYNGRLTPIKEAIKKANTPEQLKKIVKQSTQTINKAVRKDIKEVPLNQMSRNGQLLVQKLAPQKEIKSIISSNKFGAISGTTKNILGSIGKIGVGGLLSSGVINRIFKDVKSNETTKTKTGQTSKQRTGQTSKTKTGQTSKQRTGQTSKTITIQTPASKTKSITKLISKTIPKKKKKSLYIRTKSKGTPLTKKLSKPVMTYKVYVKKRGKNVLLGQRLTQTDAKNLLAYDVDNTLLRSAVIKPQSKLKVVTRLPVKYIGAFSQRQSKFRQYKIQQKKKKPIKGFIEKQKYSADTKREKKQLSRARKKKIVIKKKTKSKRKKK